MCSQCFRDPESRELQETGETTLIREVKPQPREVRQGFDLGVEGGWLWERRGYECYPSRAVDGITPIQCPFTMGEQRWVRETWCAIGYWKEPPEANIKFLDGSYLFCRAPSLEAMYKLVGYSGTHWRPAITMPRWASRATVEVVESDVFQDGGVWYWRAKVRNIPAASGGLG